MVNELRQLMREATATPPPDGAGLDAVLQAGRRRTRRRRVSAVGVTALASAAVVVVASLAWQTTRPRSLDAAGVPRPEGPVLRLSEAARAVEGRDYRVLASHTNPDLDSDNGQYFDGVTDDGLVLFRDGPRMDSWQAKYALLDPRTGDKDWLPSPGTGQQQLLPVRLGRDRLVLLAAGDGTDDSTAVAHVYDRRTRTWSRVTWPDLPREANAFGAETGPDGRLFVPVVASKGKPPPGGWPTASDGEADDAGANGDTYALWSVSLTDPSDVRDEHLTVGSFAFADGDLVWTDRTNGKGGRIHVRDLATGSERAFDPHTGERCNLLNFAATGRRIVLSEYCGTYEHGVRDDRVQVLSTDGDLVTTLQGSGIEGSLASSGGDGVVAVTSYEGGAAGTYVYDLADDRLLRVSDGMSKFGMGGPAGRDQFMWTTPEGRHGATQRVGVLLH